MIEVERQDNMLLVYLNSIANRNAFTLEVINKLSSIRCEGLDLVVFSNRGDVFSSGLDLGVFLRGSVAAREYLASLHRLVEHVLDCTATTVAYLSGDAYGFGVEFTYFVDYVVAAAPGLKLSLQGIKLGVFPPYTIMLAELLGYNVVRSLLARPITAEEAKAMGLVHHIGTLDDAIRKIFIVPRHTFRIVKYNRHMIRKHLKEEVLYQLAALADDEDTKSLISRFLRKS